MSTRTSLVVLFGIFLLSCSSSIDSAKDQENKVRQFQVSQELQKRIIVCTKHDDCSSTQICDEGICTEGECAILSDSKICTSLGKQERGCCEPWETCSSMNSCFLAADSPIGSQCVTNADCTFGKFCSAGNCYEIKNRTSCSSSFQCSASERCDLVAKLCVPEEGGCQYCDRWSELCCEASERCDSRTDRCIRSQEQECNATNVAEVCRRNQLCYEGRCVQCISDQQCGPGTKCDLEQGVCCSVRNRCSSDSDCAQQQRCLLSERLCVVPKCENDGQCQSEGTAMRCDLTQFKCVGTR